MGYGGVEIIAFPARNGLLRLGNSYDNIEWGPGKITVKNNVAKYKVGRQKTFWEYFLKIKKNI